MCIRDRPAVPAPDCVENRHSIAVDEWLDGFTQSVTDSAHLDDPRAHKYDNPYGEMAPSPRNLYERGTRTSLNKENVSKREKAAKAAEAMRPESAVRVRVPPEDAPLLPPRNQYAPVNAAKRSPAKAKKKDTAAAPRSFLHTSGRKGTPGRGSSPVRTRQRSPAKTRTVEPEHPHYGKEDPAIAAYNAGMFNPYGPPPPAPYGYGYTGAPYGYGAPHPPPAAYGYGAPHYY
eukprot:TRINITY_DN7886_c0_g1_i2.p1 TRINITY_DN7886_c0_g1~~TRINITY_DN7886_c0_g1_i2.p1  ORF type:complete len:231 (-),score=19.04 TRINITY_DN7886_c0_g1_i2:313-1005(-)